MASVMLYLNGSDSGKKLAVIGKPVSGLDKINGGLRALYGGDNLGVHIKTPNVNSTANLPHNQTALAV